MTRGQLLTATFKRMDELGITNAEDIIEKLAIENEEYRQKIAALEKECYSCPPVSDTPAIIPSPDALTINISSGRSLTINICTQGDVVPPPP